MNAAAPTLLDEVVSLLVEDGWEVFDGRTRSSLLVLVYGEDGLMPCRLELRDGDRRLSARVVFPPHIKESRLGAVHEYVLRANRALADERFDLDQDEGVLTLEASVDLVGRQVCAPQAQQLLVDVISAADHHFGAIMRLIYCQTDPFETLGMVPWSSED
jgi:hypothetical protein